MEMPAGQAERKCYRLIVPVQPLLTRIPQIELIDASRLPPDWPQAVVLCADDQWHPVTILAWCRHRRGWAVLIRWPDGSEDWRVHDARHLMRSIEHLGGWASG
jgi:hypothetical protein